MDYLEQRLKDLNYQIITAYDGQDALDKINRKQPDIVLRDIPITIISADHDYKVL